MKASFSSLGKKVLAYLLIVAYFTVSKLLVSILAS